MDAKTELIKNIKYKLMYMDLSSDQLSQIENALYLEFEDYDIQKKTTEVGFSIDSPISTLQKFIAVKNMGGYSKNTLKRYYDVNSQMLYSIGKQLNDVSSFDIQCYLINYKQNRNVSNCTLEGIHCCIDSFFDWCSKEGILHANPCSGIDHIKYDKTIKLPFTDSEMEKMKRACTNKRDVALIEFLYATGCRVSEVAALNIDNIDFQDKKAIVLGKGGKERVVYLTDTALMYLKEYLNDRTDSDPCLFKSQRGRLTKCGIEYVIKHVGKLAGVKDAHPHRFRRTLATNLMDRGASIQEVAQVLGHSDISTTQIYCYTSQKNVESTYNKCIS